MRIYRENEDYQPTERIFISKIPKQSSNQANFPQENTIEKPIVSLMKKTAHKTSIRLNQSTEVLNDQLETKLTDIRNNIKRKLKRVKLDSLSRNLVLRKVFRVFALNAKRRFLKMKRKIVKAQRITQQISLKLERIQSENNQTQQKILIIQEKLDRIAKKTNQLAVILKRIDDIVSESKNRSNQRFPIHLQQFQEVKQAYIKSNHFKSMGFQLNNHNCCHQSLKCLKIQ